MKRLGDALTLFILLMAGMPSALAATRLSLPGIPDFRLPSAGVVDTVFPAATGGAAPYTYGLSGQPPGIAFAAGTRRATGTLPTVAAETTYTVTYSVSDGAGATASVTFTATVVPPPAPPPPPPPSLSLPSIPDFRLPSAGVVDTVFPAATGGAAPYTYGVSGLPPGIAFAAGTRRATGTLPTVATETTYTVAYSVSDGAGATASVTFTATVTPPPSPLSLPAVADFSAPSGGAFDRVFPAATGGWARYSYSLTGFPAGISFSSRTRRARGTLPTVTADTTYNIVYAVRDSAGATDSVTFTATVTAPTAPPPPSSLSLPEVPDFTAASGGAFDRVLPAATGGRSPYSYTLTGLPAGLSFSSSTRRATGTLPTVAADTTYAIVYAVRDSADATASVTFTATVTAPTAPPSPDPPSTPTRVRRTLETRVGLVYATETDSPERTYSFTLASRQTVSVSLTGMNRDIDCSVNGSRCSNYGATNDDHWSGELPAGSHAVRVYPFGRTWTTGAWTITAVVNCPAGHFASGGACHRYVLAGPPNSPPPIPAPTAQQGEPEVMGCDGDTELAADQECSSDGIVVFKDSIDVTSNPTNLSMLNLTGLVVVVIPPPLAPPGPVSGPGPVPSGDSLAAATSDINCEGWNIDDDDGFDADRTNRDGTTRKHRALDIQVSSPDATFFALASGTITNRAWSPECGFQLAVTLQSGGRHVYCHMDDTSRLAARTVVSAGDVLGRYGGSGETSGPHLHLKVTDSNDRPIDPVEAFGGEDALAPAGFTFSSSDAEHCAEE